MAIAVVCPKGHKLTCPDERAGKTGKCPKCGTSFEIPEANGKPAEVAASAPDADADDAVDQGSGSGKSGRASSAGQIDRKSVV